MRVLVDSCVWAGAVGELRSAGHDVISVREWQADPGDEEILKRSIEENRVLLTLDKDFGELVFVLRLPHKGIVRLVDVRAREQGRVLVSVLAQFGDELMKDALVVVDPDRIRIRMPESGE
jgi:predicted nuclease of predicted toxin-antitoxin system